MNLETQIRPDLWSTIRSSYEARNFTSAILDGMHYLGDLLREKSGLEGDGVALIGQPSGVIVQNSESTSSRLRASGTSSEGSNRYCGVYTKPFEIRVAMRSTLTRRRMQ